ncbi:lysophospholipid acyltransferase family protein [Parapedobacter sp. 10938]|uniref:lysophospholipid acyltransferase family protein n=1 Tax=Parapedobacter flavus TaxID=3110225 RepID=UPI002DBA34DD|nr:lysophospholipid acyltransferase family protein [Parapedobacter sp. 10938]MEC3881451.1 lysophospholipid acyltransferase family protein [Parapedobacter sp. 10938]
MASVLFFFACCYPLLYVLAKNPERHYRRIARCRRIIGWLSSTCVGIRYRFSYEKAIDWSAPCIICANHTSNLDITAMVLLGPANFSFIGKIELLDNPVTGMFFRTIDIPLNRKSNRSAFTAFKQANRHLRNGRSMVIFPEGLIGEEFPPRLYDFKNGPFKLAIETKVPIVPVVIHNAWKIFWDDARQFGSRPGIVQADVLEPINTAHLQLEQADQLRDEVHALIKKHWNRTGGL